MTKQIFQVRTYIDEEDSKPSGIFDRNLPQLYGPGREQYLTNLAVCQGLAEEEKWVAPDLHAYTPGSTPVHAWDFYEYIPDR